jgi:hypothetical protein
MFYLLLLSLLSLLFFIMNIILYIIYTYVLYKMSFGYSISFLNVFAMLSILLGIFIIINNNPIISVLYSNNNFYCNKNKSCKGYIIIE